MYIIIQKGGESLKSRHFRENTWIRVFLQGVLYFWRPGGLAELVDCTGLENRRAERYRGFESLSLRQIKTLAIMRAFFLFL